MSQLRVFSCLYSSVIFANLLLNQRRYLYISIRQINVSQSIKFCQKALFIYCTYSVGIGSFQFSKTQVYFHFTDHLIIFNKTLQKYLRTTGVSMICNFSTQVGTYLYPISKEKQSNILFANFISKGVGCAEISTHPRRSEPKIKYAYLSSS